jgi:hypothetical protein
MRLLGVLVLLVACTPHGTVTVGGGFAKGDGALRLDDPFRAVLALDRPLGRDARLDVELRKDGTLDKLLTVRAEAKNDEVYLAFPNTGRIVSGAGAYTIVFLLDGKPLGEGRFSVSP